MPPTDKTPVTPYTLHMSFKDWQAANRVIEKFLKELIPSMTDEHLFHNAVALQARLIREDPVLYITRRDVILWEDTE
jgi:hypothetical protein